jgi:enoyl-CoA hydratase/carnithine racemase
VDTKPVVIHEKRDAVFWITINRPERRNAVTAEVMAGIRAGIRSANEDAAIRAIVLTGAGEKAFCAGADLAPGQRFVFDHSRNTTDYCELLREVKLNPLPLVARVNGTVMAGGTGLVAMCDMAVAADHAQFGMPEVKIGLFPMQIYVVLKERITPIKLNEWCLTGEPFDAREAMEGGLVSYVVPAAELDSKVEWLLSRLIDKSPTAIRRGKYAMSAMNTMTFAQAAVYAEAQLPTLTMTEDAKEGKAAFNEKRKPAWTGR